METLKSTVAATVAVLAVLADTVAWAGSAAQFPPRTVRNAAGITGEGDGGGLIENVRIPAAPEYYLDYTVTFRPGFDWIPYGRPRGGKLPGLAGGEGTGGCRPIEPDGWSARQTWGANGAMTLYLYHQDRNGACGDKFAYTDEKGNQVRLVTGKRYRLTERVKVNTPDKYDGLIQIWLDGKLVLSKGGLRLRGKVGPKDAMVSQLKYHSYFGGKSWDFAPSRDSYVDYGPLYVMACMPDFAKAPGACKAGS
jgi:hypothetical protein